MSNRLYQTVIHQMKDVIGRSIGVIDDNGIIVAASEFGKIGESRQIIREDLPYSSDSMVYDGYTYRFVNAAEKSDIIVFVEGDDDQADKMCQLIAISLGNIKNLYKQKH